MKVKIYLLRILMFWLEYGICNAVGYGSKKVDKPWNLDTTVMTVYEYIV